MSKSTSFQPAHRLASILRTPGGLSVEDAVTRAHERVESIRVQCVDALDGKIEAMSKIAIAGASPAQVYVLSSEIFSLAATFGLEKLSQAASSLCDVLARTQAKPEIAQSGPVFVESVAVHVAALRTLRRSDLGEEARTTVVEGLRKIAAKFRSEDED